MLISDYYHRLAGDPAYDSRLAAIVARRLEDEAFRGTLSDLHLGTEERIADRLAIGRGTVREAVRLLELRGTVIIRRGNQGGIVARAPSTDIFRASLVDYFRRSATSSQDIMEARRVLEAAAAIGGEAGPLLTELARLLGKCAHNVSRGIWLSPLALTDTGGGRAREIARTIAARLPAIAAGTRPRITSEDEICEHHRVCRAVAREAIRVLEECGLVGAVRGRGNGVMGVDVHPGATIRHAYGFFRSRLLHKVACVRAIELLGIELTRRAARNATETDQRRIADLVVQMRSGEKHHGVPPRDGIVVEARNCAQLRARYRPTLFAGLCRAVLPMLLQRTRGHGRRL